MKLWKLKPRLVQDDKPIRQRSSSCVRIKVWYSVLYLWWMTHVWGRATDRLSCVYHSSCCQTILQSSSRTGWPLRNIHLSNSNGYFPFYIDFFYRFCITNNFFYRPWLSIYKGNNKITELRIIFQRESQHSKYTNR